MLVTTEAAALPLHPLHFAPEMPAAVAQNARVSPARSTRLGRHQTVRAEVARFCMSHASFASYHQATLFARPGKRFVAELSDTGPPANKMRSATQQVPREG